MALVGERVENGMGDNTREQLWHWSCLVRYSAALPFAGCQMTANGVSRRGESREGNGREQERTTVALVGKRVA